MRLSGSVLMDLFADVDELLACERGFLLNVTKMLVKAGPGWTPKRTSEFDCRNLVAVSERSSRARPRSASSTEGRGLGTPLGRRNGHSLVGGPEH